MLPMYPITTVCATSIYLIRFRGHGIILLFCNVYFSFTFELMFSFFMSFNIICSTRGVRTEWTLPHYVCQNQIIYKINSTWILKHFYLFKYPRPLSHTQKVNINEPTTAFEVVQVRRCFKHEGWLRLRSTPVVTLKSINIGQIWD